MKYVSKIHGEIEYSENDVLSFNKFCFASNNSSLIITNPPSILLVLFYNSMFPFLWHILPQKVIFVKLTILVDCV